MLRNSKGFGGFSCFARAGLGLLLLRQGPEPQGAQVAEKLSFLWAQTLKEGFVRQLCRPFRFAQARELP